MKITKLIPCATVASTIAIVVPLVTSCGSGTYTLILKNAKDYKLVDQKTGSMKEDEATKIYFEDIEKLQSCENWEELTKILIHSAKKLEKGIIYK